MTPRPTLDELAAATMRCPHCGAIVRRDEFPVPHCERLDPQSKSQCGLLGSTGCGRDWAAIGRDRAARRVGAP